MIIGLCAKLGEVVLNRYYPLFADMSGLLAQRPSLADKIVMVNILSLLKENE